MATWTTWEYESFLSHGPDLVEQLNMVGKQGWGAIAVIPATTVAEASAPAGITGLTTTQWGASQYRVVLKRVIGQGN
jgi:hypothetical protein